MRTAVHPASQRDIRSCTPNGMASGKSSTTTLLQCLRHLRQRRAVIRTSPVNTPTTRRRRARDRKHRPFRPRRRHGLHPLRPKRRRKFAWPQRLGPQTPGCHPNNDARLAVTPWALKSARPGGPPLGPSRSQPHHRSPRRTKQPSLGRAPHAGRCLGSPKLKSRYVRRSWCGSPTRGSDHISQEN